MRGASRARATLARAINRCKSLVCRRSEAASRRKGPQSAWPRTRNPQDSGRYTPADRHVYRYVHLDTAQGVSRITLNRPPANVLSIDMMQELAQALESLEYEKDVKLMTLFGGGKYFSAGFELNDHLGDRAYLMLEGFRHIFEALAKVDKPTLAVVAGPALGAGCLLAGSCDIVLAAQSAKFAHPEIRGGVFNTVSAALLAAAGRPQARLRDAPPGHGPHRRRRRADRPHHAGGAGREARRRGRGGRPALPGVERARGAARPPRHRGRARPAPRRGREPRGGRLPQPADGDAGRRGGPARGRGEAQARLEGPVSGEGPRASHGDWDTVLEARQVYEAELAAGRLRESGIEARVIDQSYRQEPVPSVRALSIVRVLVPEERAEEARRLLAEAAVPPGDTESEET